MSEAQTEPWYESDMQKYTYSRLRQGSAMESLLAFMDTNYKATKEAFERGIMYEVMKVRA